MLFKDNALEHSKGDTITFLFFLEKRLEWERWIHYLIIKQSISELKWKGIFWLFIQKYKGSSYVSTKFLNLTESEVFLLLRPTQGVQSSAHWEQLL